MANVSGLKNLEQRLNHAKSTEPGNQKNEKKPLTNAETLHTSPHYFDQDVCTPEDRNPKYEKYLHQFTKKTCRP